MYQSKAAGVPDRHPGPISRPPARTLNILYVWD